VSINLNRAAIKVKINGKHTCIFCGSTEYIQGHHLVPRDDNTIIPLCAFCHHAFHPKMSLSLFTNHTQQPYWFNKSAASIAKEIGMRPQTIYRRSLLLGIPRGYLSPADELRLKSYKRGKPQRKNIEDIDISLIKDKKKASYYYARKNKFSSMESAILAGQTFRDIDRIAKERDQWKVSHAS
jgi:hypothetical protein